MYQHDNTLTIDLKKIGRASCTRKRKKSVVPAQGKERISRSPEQGYEKNSLAPAQG
jgi:hypothetical protein